MRSSCTRSSITMGLDKKPFMPLSGKAALAYLSYITARKSVRCKPAHRKDAANILRVSCFVLSLYRKRTENDRNIKIFYHWHEGFSMNFHIFIHKNHACPISLHRRTWRAENCGGSLRYCTPRMASVVILYCSVTRANHSPEPSSVPARSTSVSS